MKKIYLLILSIACLCSLAAFAASPCDSEQNYQKRMAQPYQTPYKKPCQKPCQKPTEPCKKPCESPQPCQKAYKNDCFLCTNKNMNTLFSQMHLSETQICTAMKIQDKYALEVLSLNEKIQCEEQKLAQLKASCSKKSDIRKQKRYIKKLKKERKKICKCYEDQFKTLLSNPQKKAYNKAKK